MKSNRPPQPGGLNPSYSALLDASTTTNAKNPLASRLQPKSLHQSVSVPILKVSTSQGNLLKQKSTQRLHASSSMVVSGNSADNNPLVSSGFFPTNRPKSTTIDESYNKTYDADGLDRNGHTSSQVLGSTKDTQPEETRTKTFLESLNLTAKEQYDLLHVRQSLDFKIHSFHTEVTVI